MKPAAALQNSSVFLAHSVHILTGTNCSTITGNNCGTS